MCYICNSSPHLVSCPFYTAKAITCEVCGGVIRYDEVSYKLNNEVYHSHCLRELNGMDIIEALRIEPQKSK